MQNGHRPIIVHIDCANEAVRELDDKTNKITSWWVRVFAHMTKQSIAEVRAIVKAWRVRWPPSGSA